MSYHVTAAVVLGCLLVTTSCGGESGGDAVTTTTSPTAPSAFQTEVESLNLTIDAAGCFLVTNDQEEVVHPANYCVRGFDLDTALVVLDTEGLPWDGSKVRLLASSLPFSVEGIDGVPNLDGRLWAVPVSDATQLRVDQSGSSMKCSLHSTDEVDYILSCSSP